MVRWIHVFLHVFNKTFTHTRIQLIKCKSNVSKMITQNTALMKYIISYRILEQNLLSYLWIYSLLQISRDRVFLRRGTTFLHSSYLVVTVIISGCHGDHIWSPWWSYLVAMVVISGCHCDHIWLPWWLYLVAMVILSSCHGDYIWLLW
jgi:hypothetical protein